MCPEHSDAITVTYITLNFSVYIWFSDAHNGPYVPWGQGLWLFSSMLFSQHLTQSQVDLECLVTFCHGYYQFISKAPTFTVTEIWRLAREDKDQLLFVDAFPLLGIGQSLVCPHRSSWQPREIGSLIIPTLEMRNWGMKRLRKFSKFSQMVEEDEMIPSNINP